MKLLHACGGEPGDEARVLELTRSSSVQDYKAEWDPSKVRSEKAQRGPLAKDWKETADPVMCCYKFVEVEFKWWGLQGTVESRVQKVRVHCICTWKYMCMILQLIKHPAD